MGNLRSYKGLADPTGVFGRPKASKPEEDIGCPECGCEEVMLIEVIVAHDLLRTPKGKGIYMGCPACPWASPMAITAMEESGK